MKQIVQGKKAVFYKPTNSLKKERNETKKN